MIPTIHTQFKRPVTRYRAFTLPSLTVPDQTLSLKTMVTKYVKGLPIAAPDLKGQYTDDEVATDFEKLDLAEQEEIILNVSNELTKTKGKIAKEREETAAKRTAEAEKDKKELEELRAKLALTP